MVRWCFLHTLDMANDVVHHLIYSITRRLNISSQSSMIGTAIVPQNKVLTHPCKSYWSAGSLSAYYSRPSQRTIPSVLLARGAFTACVKPALLHTASLGGSTWQTVSSGHAVKAPLPIKPQHHCRKLREQQPLHVQDNPRRRLVECQREPESHHVRD